MGWAKKKLFGIKTSNKLEKFIQRGVLLPIDIAYAELQHPQGPIEKIALHAAMLASTRAGHLCLEKSLIEDPQLAALLPEGRHYLPKYAYIEDQIVAEVKRLLSYPAKKKNPLAPRSLTAQQQNAVIQAQQFPISFITGGPGTGKTHTAAHIVRIFSTKTIAAAPTGKAAAHLLGKIQGKIEGGTLHSLLKQEIILDAHLVIVDECSMIDPFLFHKLLVSIGPETNLVLMGDMHQLPAVDGGSVFADLLASEMIPSTTLTECMRSDRSEILDLAKKVLDQGASIPCTIDLGFSTNQIETIYENLWEYVKEKDFSHFRILSTLRRGPLGVDAINRFLYEKFSAQKKPIPILITRNDSRTGLSNGETGILQENRAFFDEKTFDIYELPPFEFAYCLSVHKSQGSEYDDVLFLVPDGSENFGREVLYTAITRARHTLAIDGNPMQIEAALKRSSRKISGIRDKMRE